MFHIAAPCWRGGQQYRQARSLQPRLCHLPHLHTGEQRQWHHRWHSIDALDVGESKVSKIFSCYFPSIVLKWCYCINKPQRSSYGSLSAVIIAMIFFFNLLFLFRHQRLWPAILLSQQQSGAMLPSITAMVTTAVRGKEEASLWCPLPLLLVWQQQEETMMASCTVWRTRWRPLHIASTNYTQIEHPAPPIQQDPLILSLSTSCLVPIQLLVRKNE